MGRLDEKVALITGAARGLGFAIARRFREEGARVVVNDVNGPQAERAAAELGGLAFAADVSDSKAVAEMVKHVGEKYGRLDVLVNNAGINGLEGDPEQEAKFRHTILAQTGEMMAGGPVRTHFDFAVELSDDDWRKMIAVHLDGTFFCSRESLKLMNARGSGSIINMASVLGTTGAAGACAYGAAKAGILGLTRCLAREVASRNIRVNAIAPGWIESDMTTFLGEARALMEAQTPLGRMGSPDDIGWAAVYLASEEARFVTGQVLSPNGGLHMSQ